MNKQQKQFILFDNNYILLKIKERIELKKIK